MNEFSQKQGWTVTLYSDEGQTNNRQDGYDYLSWSPYDRIQIRTTYDFKEFIFPSDEWCGVKQQLHLIPYYYFMLEDTASYSANDVDWKCNLNNYLISRSSNFEYYGLQCIVTFRLAEDVLDAIVNGHNESYSEKSEILKSITANLENFGKKNHLQFDCIAFETLGSEDFAFILLSNELEVFSALLYAIRRQYNTALKGKSIFSNICSIAGFNNIHYSYTPSIRAKVRLNLKSVNKKRKVLDSLKIKFKHQKYTEYDLLQGICSFEVIFVPTDLLLWHPEKHSEPKGLLNGESDFYKKYIISSRTVWIENEKEECVCEDSDCIVPIPERILSELLERNNTKNDNTDFEYHKSNNTSDKGSSKIIINDKDEEKEKNHIIEFILGEYDRMISLSRCVEWKTILQRQRCCLDRIKEYVSQNDTATSELTGGMQAVLTHINQACTPIYEVPYHNHYYSGSFDDILKMYYGIIGFIQKVGTEIPKTKKLEDSEESESTHSDFIYGIRFDSVENIRTHKFYRILKPDQLIIFDLPYSALYDFESSAKLLVHEVFHYIPPIDREYRNKQIFRVWMEYLFIRMEKSDWHKNIGKSIKGVLFTDICDYTIEDFLEEYYNVFKCEYTDISKYEIALFMLSELVLDAVITFEATVSKKLYDKKRDVWNKLICQLKPLSLEKDSKEIDALDAFVIWAKELGVINGMKELVNVIKEFYCDLFMCAIHQMNLQEYIKLLKLYRTSQKISLKYDDMSLAYRIVLISAVLRSNYCTDSVSFTMPNDELEMLKEVLSIEKNSNNSQNLDALIKNINNACCSTKVCNAILNIFGNEINYLRTAPRSVFGFNDNSIKDIVTMGDPYSRESFEKKIKMMHLFMSYDQEPQKQHLDKPEVHYSISSIKDDTSKAKSVSSVSEYINEMFELSHACGRQLWYRGVCDETYTLTPSLFRNMDQNLSPYAQQVNYLKLAYSATMHYPEMWKGKITEQVSLLQHYGMPTNLLDFSLDMLTALHFALNPDGIEDRSQMALGLKTPMVYVFDPIEYANAVTALKLGGLFSNNYTISPILYDVADDDVQGYFPTKMDAEMLIEHSQRNLTPPYYPNTRTNEYPLPIIIRQSNARILVQGGVFVAFSLNSKPDATVSKNFFDYLDLRRIEKKYQELQEKSGCHVIKHFLYKIAIPASCINSIRHDIKIMHITESSVYPELYRIFQDALK